MSRVYGGIPATKLAVVAADFEIADKSKALLKGGFHYGVTIRGTPYVPPRPLMNHGPHRCKLLPCNCLAISAVQADCMHGTDFFFVVALSEPLDRDMLQARATREQIAEAINGKVLGWGQWFGSCERVWK